MQILALTEQILNQVHPYWEYVKQEMRTWLGPVPLTYYLFEDGRVLPSTIELPESVRSAVFTFNPFSKRIQKLSSLEEGRFKPLPYIGIVLKASSEEIDITEWVGEIRAFPIPEFITAKQIILLWSHVHNKYVSFANASIHIIKDDGDEETIYM
jgi:hypothetical protein